MRSALLRVRYAMNTESGEEVALKIIEKERIKADDFGESLKKEVRVPYSGAAATTSKTP